ncbi:glycosyl hydrolase [Caulobacter sp. Root655]|uniref:endo-1,4-beta-xylanase n=1 Tax=Caulobacter sp. Root655 TaxID=1736578 RepID=UPI000700EF96|nr:endo-1,4-beta-xylanase [Caulobacter sp. Root655]KRA61130.1 glycosyl hydrolase [Caulobacter sp. Root655]
MNRCYAPGPSRRGVLGSGLAAGALVLGATSARGSTPSLASLAKAKGLRFGTAVGAGPVGSITGSFEDARHRQLLIDECGVLVPENELKWYVLRPDAKTFAFERADRIAAFAQAHDIALRGHTLLWHHPQWFPAWLDAYDFGPRPATSAEAMLVDHITRVCAHYPQIDSWDVVNETIDPTDGAIRRTVFSEAMGQERTLDVAYHAARAAAPRTRLVYNDYMSWEAGNETHRAGVLKLLEGFRARGTPVDALGVQSHIGAENADSFTGFGRPQEREWRAFLDEATGMGYDLAITEFDVHDKGLPLDFAARDAAVAAYGRAYLDLMLSYRQTKEVLAWGLVDKYSWLQNQWPRQDGKPKRPTLYDNDYRPKPLREAMAAAFRSAASR